MSIAVEGYGSLFESTPDSIVFTPRAEVVKITAPSIEGKAIEVTHLTSQAGFREFVVGVADGGEVTLEMNMTKLEVTFFYATIRTKNNWRITFSQGSQWLFAAIMTKLGNEVPFDDKINMAVTFKISGKPVWTA